MMTSQVNKQSVVSSLMWKFLERGGMQGVMFVVSIILARLLIPEDYGIIALTTIFLRIANVFVQSGFNTSLIQKKNVNDTDYCSVFYLSLFVAAILYIIIYFTSPLIAGFYKEPQLVNILRVLSITLFFGAISSVQNTIIARNMMFKKLFYSSLFSIVASGAIGISMAYYGCGVWALVVQQISVQLITIIVLLITLNWRPKVLFSFIRIKSLFSYGWKILASSLLDTFYNEIRSLIIGRMYNASMLGYYNRGRKFPQQIITSVNGTIQSVMFPTLSAHQDDIPKVKKMVRRSITTSTFVIFPLMMGMAVVAHPMVSILLTNKWLPCVPYLQIFCLAFMLWPIHTTNLQSIKALGRSDIYLKLEIVKKIMGLITLAITIPFGVFYMALSIPITGIIGAVINAYPNSKLLNYSLKEQCKDILPPLLSSLVMGIVVYSISFIGLNDWLTLITQVISGIVLYISIAKLFKIESYEYLKNIVKDIIKRKITRE